MDGLNITVDSQDLEKAFDRLVDKDQRKVFRSALQASIAVLRKQTITNLKKSIKSNNPWKLKNGGYGKRPTQMLKTKVGKKLTYAKLSLTPKGGGSTLHWFEVGTSLRRTKKGYNRGRIKGKYFHTQAKNQVEGAMFKVLDDNIAESIRRIWENKYE